MTAEQYATKAISTILCADDVDYKILADLFQAAMNQPPENDKSKDIEKLRSGFYEKVEYLEDRGILNLHTAGELRSFVNDLCDIYYQPPKFGDVKPNEAGWYWYEKNKDAPKVIIFHVNGWIWHEKCCLGNILNIKGRFTPRLPEGE